MRYLRNAWVLTFFLFSGCSTNGAKMPLMDAICGYGNNVIVRKEYIKTKCPKRVRLKAIPAYRITDYKSYNEVYYLINKKQFAKSQQTCHRLRQKIWILEQ